MTRKDGRDTRQARRDLQRQQSENARAVREQADQKRVNQVVERGRSRAYGVGGRDAANECGESGVDNRFPTRGRKRGRGAIGAPGQGANPGAPRG